MVRVVERGNDISRFWLNLTNYLAGKNPSCIWSRRLTDEEIVELNKFPYKMLEGTDHVKIGNH